MIREDDASADSAYEPFARFAEWQHVEVQHEAWDAVVSLLNAVRNEAPADACNAVLEELTRAAAIDTGAVEGLYETDRGFTETMARESALYEALVAERGEDVAKFVTAQLDGFHMVLETATGQSRLTAMWLRQLHATITRSQPTYSVVTPVGPQDVPLPHGEYKKSPNHVRLRDGSIFPYAPVQDTPHEVNRLLTELNAADFSAAPPALQSAYAHYAFIRIHPFADGNGRVARALASLYLYRAASIPFLLYVSERGRYLDALHAADGGDLRAFVRFVEGRAIETAQLATEQLQAAAAGDLKTLAAALNDLVTTKSGLTVPEVDALMARLAEELSTQLDGLASELDLAPGVQFIHQRGHAGFVQPPADHRFPTNGPLRVYVGFHTVAPFSASATLYIDVLTPTDRASRDTVVFRVADSLPAVSLSLSTEELYPEITAGARLRVHTFARLVIARTLAELRQRVEAAARGSDR